MAGESCKNVNPSQNPNPNLKCKKTFLENIQNPCQRIKSKVTVAYWKLQTIQIPISKQKSKQKTKIQNPPPSQKKILENK